MDIQKPANPFTMQFCIKSVYCKTSESKVQTIYFSQRSIYNSRPQTHSLTSIIKKKNYPKQRMVFYVNQCTKPSKSTLMLRRVQMEREKSSRGKKAPPPHYCILKLYFGLKLLLQCSDEQWLSNCHDGAFVLVKKNHCTCA